MRLIDADKIVYSWQQDRNGKFHDGVTLESIINNIPTENINDLITKELEKIKDRLEVAMWYNRRDKEYCLEFIDKRISELKGDDKPLN